MGSGQLWRTKDTHRSSVNLTGTRDVNTDYGHVFVSKDKGRTWTTVQLDPALDVAKMFVDPGDSDIVFLAANVGFFKSTDGGYHWAAAGRGLPYNQPRDADYFYDPVSKELVLYLVEQTHFGVDPANPRTTVATGGAYASRNRGDTWIPIMGNVAVDMTAIHQSLATACYFRCIAYWFNMTIAAAQQRFPDLPAETFTVFNRIVASKTRKDTLFLGYNIKHDFAFGPGEIFRTSDGGATWVAVARNGVYWVTERDSAFWRARGNSLGMNMQYAHLDREMRTTDNDAGLRVLVAKPDGDLIAIHEQQTLRSMDHGDSWAQIDDDETAPGSGRWVGRGGSNLPGVTMLMDTGRPEYLFASGEHGLWRGASGGDGVVEYGIAVEQLSGQRIGPYGATSICSVAVHPADPDVVYIQMFRQSFRGMVRKSVDGGVTWVNISYPIKSNSAISPNEIIQKDLMISAADPATMLFTVPRTTYCPYTPTHWRPNGAYDFSDFGVYRSTDGGVRWSWLSSNGLPAAGSVARLAMAPNNSDVIWAALNSVNLGAGGAKVPGGLYRTTDGGDTWRPVSIPPEIVGLNHVSIDRRSGAVYIAAGEFDGDVAAGGVWRRASATAPWEKLFFMPHVKECYPSPANPDFLVVSVGMGKAVGELNPGVYYSKTGGASWTKANYRLGQPGRIMAIRPDLHDDSTVWTALYGSGWYKGVIIGGDVRAMAPNLYLRSGAAAQLDGRGSIGANLSYMWSGPLSNPTLSAVTAAAPTFTAPSVDAGTEVELKYNLTVSGPTRQTDMVEVRVLVRGG